MSEQLMQAIRVHQYGGPEQLKLERILRPEPLADEVLVRIHAAGVLPIEWKVCQGFFQAFNPATFPYIPGSAFAGVIEEVGVGVTIWKTGQAVFGRSLKGTYAEYTTVSAEIIAFKPVSLSFNEAAAISGGATTAWEALFDRGELQSGQRVLILGAAGGVGHFAVQFARWKGALIIGTAGPTNVDFVSSLGAQTVIDYTMTQISQLVRDIDLVLDTVGGSTLATAWPVFKRGGMLISIAGMPSQEQARELGLQAQFFAGSPPPAIACKPSHNCSMKAESKSRSPKRFPCPKPTSPTNSAKAVTGEDASYCTSPTGWQHRRAYLFGGRGSEAGAGFL